MTHLLKTLTASLVAATIGTAALITPASAGGQVSFTIAPKNAKEEQALKTGLTIYAIVHAVQNGASIKQKGMNNQAGIGQFGAGNLGIVHQEGNGHSGTLVQNGNGNAYGVFQFGKNTNANAVQNGNGQTGATVSFGW